MDPSWGVITMPHRQTEGQPFTRTDYLLTLPWYRTALPPRLEIQAGCQGLGYVLTQTRQTHERRNIAPAVTDAIEALILGVFSDPWASTIRLHNPRHEDQFPRLTVGYPHNSPRYHEAHLWVSHNVVHLCIQRFVAALAPVLT